ncbi:MAG: hypothetical protein AVDCRST_MAG65-1491 [uncultured Solirubrobacteraceae bacterium]|uniref:Uncharacterized protein n=1 Tax=uncultured Solirubrobacteraceae bacterium TaxID=1162706 RepID=A0A6J4RUL1_9ACTN|nr:MAG: hypothetical protein AVDCRST_MAG65-1491 [uncultured Solirubrobacteraceae bacterium]
MPATRPERRAAGTQLIRAHAQHRQRGLARPERVGDLAVSGQLERRHGPLIEQGDEQVAVERAGGVESGEVGERRGVLRAPAAEGQGDVRCEVLTAVPAILGRLAGVVAGQSRRGKRITAMGPYGCRHRSLLLPTGLVTTDTLSAVT